MKHQDFLDTEYTKFFNSVEEKDITPKKQITTFLKWCFDKGLLDDISDKELECFYNKNYISLPLLSNKSITVGIEPYNNYYYVGIDPKKCFNKTNQCSILFMLPITSKREEEQLYNTLEMLLENKSKEAKYWYKEAGHLLCGDYFTNTK